LRGSKRETGIWDLKKKTWTRTGEGCQINWTPAGDEIYWVHPTGNGGSRVLHLPVANGKPSKSDADLDAITLIDLPGRRSHEYFPQLSADGKWLVWAATQRGHDHDIADYEIYLWEVGTPADSAVRLTYHSAMTAGRTSSSARQPQPSRGPQRRKLRPKSRARKRPHHRLIRPMRSPARARRSTASKTPPCGRRSQLQPTGSVPPGLGSQT
jgi:hypothetical protein